MDYKIGTKVYTDGKLLGSITYLIVAPHSHHTTHLVIKHSAKHTLKIIPLELIDIQTKRAIVLPRNKAWGDLADYDAEFYESINGDSHILVPKPFLHPLYYYPQIEIDKVDQLSEYDVSDKLKTGMSVFDNHAQKCGIVVDWNEDETGQLVSLVIRIHNGDIHEARIPVSWISYTTQQDMYLGVERSTLIR